MTEHSEISTLKASAVEQTEPTQGDPERTPLQNFLLGAFFGILPVFVGLGTSSYMTHTPVAEFGVIRLVLAACVPLAVGILGVAFKGKFLDALGDVLASTSL